MTVNREAKLMGLKAAKDHHLSESQHILSSKRSFSAVIFPCPVSWVVHGGTGKLR